MSMTMARHCEPRLPVGDGLGLDVPVYVRLSDLAGMFGVPRQYACRAQDLRFVVPVAWVGEIPLFDPVAGRAGMLAYLASRPKSMVARRALEAIR